MKIELKPVEIIKNDKNKSVRVILMTIEFNSFLKRKYYYWSWCVLTHHYCCCFFLEEKKVVAFSPEKRILFLSLGFVRGGCDSGVVVRL